MPRTTKRQPSASATRGPMKTLGLRIKQLREARGLSQREFAGLIGVEVMQINRYERGINLPSVETVVKLAQALHITTDELLMEGPTPPRAPEIRNLKLYERFRTLDRLPRQEQETAVSVLDGIIAKHELARLASQIQESA